MSVDLEEVCVDRTRIVPTYVRSAGGTESVVVRIVGPDGKSRKRARRFRGEMAVMDAQRFMGDAEVNLRHGAWASRRS